MAVAAAAASVLAPTPVSAPRAHAERCGTVQSVGRGVRHPTAPSLAPAEFYTPKAVPDELYTLVRACVEGNATVVRALWQPHVRAHARRRDPGRSLSSVCGRPASPRRAPRTWVRPQGPCAPPPTPAPAAPRLRAAAGRAPRTPGAGRHCAPTAERDSSRAARGCRVPAGAGNVAAPARHRAPIHGRLADGR